MRSDYRHTYSYNKFYHVFNRSNGGKDLFVSEEDFGHFLNKYKQYFSQVFDTLAYCLMPNHFHLLIRVKGEEDIKAGLQLKQDSKAIKRYIMGESNIENLISDQYRRLFSSYSLRYNKKYKSRGQLFVAKHKRVEVRQTQILDKACYIHHNPIHHGFSADYQHWMHSSYHSYLENSASWIKKELICLKFKNLYQIHEDYKKIHMNKIDEV